MSANDGSSPPASTGFMCRIKPHDHMASTMVGVIVRAASAAGASASTNSRIDCTCAGPSFVMRPTLYDARQELFPVGDERAQHGHRAFRFVAEHAVPAVREAFELHDVGRETRNDLLRR